MFPVDLTEAISASTGEQKHSYAWHPQLCTVTRSSGDVLLDVRNVGKVYGSTVALVGVDLQLRCGQIHALMGENGAGKSTLVKILVGVEQPSSGELLFNGQPQRFPTVASAIRAGIVPIYQHLTLFPNLSVVENLFGFEIARRGTSLPHRRRDSRTRAEALLTRLGLDLDLDRQVASLSLAEQQLLEIARGLQRDCRVLLLDEPTAALNTVEADRLAGVVRKLASEDVAIVYISHKTNEIQRLADRVTVLRDGRSVIAGAAMTDVPVTSLIDAMVGHAFTVDEKSLPTVAAPVVEASDVAITPDAAPFSLTIGRGEIVGVIGLAGAGAEEIGAAVAGAMPFASGRIAVAGRALVPGDRRQAITLGVGYVPPERHADGLFFGLSAAINASASIVHLFKTWKGLSAKRERSHFTGIFARMALMPNSPHRAIEHFSGGNQQKVLLARSLEQNGLHALVLNEPTRGVDIAARDRIHDEIVAAAWSGKAVLLVTTDLEELTSLAHRILIVRNRRIAMELTRPISPDEIGNAMAEAAT